jgi:hypothetical protein
MYNTSFLCTYLDIEDINVSDEQYQIELLAAFNLSEISDKLSVLVEKVYNELNYPYMKEILDYIPITFSSDPVILFMCLFSYDYFKYIHELIVNIILKQDTKINHEKLIHILKSKNV